MLCRPFDSDSLYLYLVSFMPLTGATAKEENWWPQDGQLARKWRRSGRNASVAPTLGVVVVGSHRLSATFRLVGEGEGATCVSNYGWVSGLQVMGNTASRRLPTDQVGSLVSLSPQARHHLEKETESQNA